MLILEVWIMLLVPSVNMTLNIIEPNCEKKKIKIFKISL
jgi:hypothetical protein